MDDEINELIEAMHNGEIVDSQMLADLEFEADGFDHDHDEIDGDIAYGMGYSADPFADCPFEYGTLAADSWLAGRDASEIDDMQHGELAVRYREPGEL